MKRLRPETAAGKTAYAVLRAVCMALSLCINAFLMLLFVEMIARSDIAAALEWIAWRPDLALLCGGLIFAVSAALTFCLGGMARSLLFTNLFFFLMATVHHYVLEF